MAKNLTNFLIALNDSIKLRDKWRDPEKSQKLLEQWGLEDEPALQAGGDLEKMKATVEAESGTKQVDLWIRAAGAPVRNDKYDAGA